MMMIKRCLNSCTTLFSHRQPGSNLTGRCSTVNVNYQAQIRVGISRPNLCAEIRSGNSALKLGLTEGFGFFG